MAFVASGITAVSSSLYDDRAEANLRKYNRCLEEKNEEELQLRKKKARLEVLIRKDSIRSKGFDSNDIKKSIEIQLLDENDDLLSYGPCFGEEAADQLGKKLESKGLKYVDDYYIFQGDFPDWLSFTVSFVKA